MSERPLDSLEGERSDSDEEFLEELAEFQRELERETVLTTWARETREHLDQLSLPLGEKVNFGSLLRFLIEREQQAFSLRGSEK